jgi:hypothetical protein
MEQQNFINELFRNRWIHLLILMFKNIKLIKHFKLPWIK